MLSKGLIPREFVNFGNPLNAALGLNDAAPIVKQYNLELQIKGCKKAFNKSALKYNRLEEKAKSLQQKKIDLEGKIQKNQQEMQFRIVEMGAKRHLLADSYSIKDKNNRQ